MKKLLAVLLCASLALSLGGCSIIGTIADGFKDRVEGTGETPAPAHTQESAGIPNPMQEVANAAAFSDIGISMDAPEGATDVKYYIINNELAQVNFTLGGFDYTYRASKTQTDISGVFDTFADAFFMDYEADGATFTAAAQNASAGGRLVTWSAGGVNYSLWCALAPDDAALSACVLGALEKSFASVTAIVPLVAEPVDFFEAQTLDMDLNSDGALEHVSFIEQYDAQGYVTCAALRVTSDDGADVSEDLEIMGYLSALFAYDIDGDGLVELFISGDICSSDYETWLFRYDEGALITAAPAYEPDYEYDYVLSAAFGSVTKLEGAVVTINNTVDILGSWWCETQYQMKAGGFGLERVPGSVWTYASSGYTAGDWDWAAITAAEFPVTLDGESTPTTLPVGTKLVPVDTDGKTYIHFVTQEGVKGTLYVHFNADSWGYSIGGVSEYDLFSNLPYAG